MVDVLATDVYRAYAERDYEELLALSKTKPVALAEVGTPPTAELLAQQPRWTWFMTWGEPSGDRQGDTLGALYESKTTLTLEELPWVHLPHPLKIHYPILK